MAVNGRTSTKRRDDNRKNIIFKTAIMMMIGAALVVFAALGWFAMNKTASTTGMGIQMKDFPFELEVRGNVIENSEVITDDELFNEGFTNGVRQSDGLGGYSDAYRTSDNNDKIFWRTGSSNEYVNGLEPGAHGAMTFYVIPSESGELDVSFDFNIRGYHAYYDENDELDELIEITDSLTDTPAKGITNAQNKKTALNYLKTHVLFFKDYDENTGYYSGFCDLDSIDFNDFIEGNNKSVVAGRDYEVTVYWIWVNDFIDLLLETNSNYSGSQMFADNNTEDREAIMEYLEDTTNNKFFDGLTDSQIETHLGNLQDNDSANDYNSLKALTDAYDDADLMIGNNVNYMLIEMTATAN